MSALDDYNKVKAYKEKNPAESITAIMKKFKINPSGYYYISAQQKKKAKPKTKTKYKRMSSKTDIQPTTANVTVIMGTPEQIRQVLQ